MPNPNLSYIDELAMGEQEFKEKLINIIRTELPAEVDAYYECFPNNSDLAAQWVHKLKHKISILGMSESYEMAVRHEADLRNGSWNSHEEFVRILESMRLFIEQV